MFNLIILNLLNILRSFLLLLLLLHLLLLSCLSLLSWCSLLVNCVWNMCCTSTLTSDFLCCLFCSGTAHYTSTRGGNAISTWYMCTTSWFSTATSLTCSCSWPFVLLEDIIIVYSKFTMNVRDWLWKFRNKLGWSTTINGKCGDDCIWWQYGIIQYLWVIVNLCPVANYTILSNLYIITYLECTDDAILVDVHVVSNCHFGISETTLLFHIAGSDDTFFSYDCINAHWDLSKVSS